MARLRPPRPLVWLIAVAAMIRIAGPAPAQSNASIGANFTTMTLDTNFATFGTGLQPPDTMGAAGLNHFVSYLNGSFSIYTKAGTQVSGVSDRAFWTSALGSDPGNLSDPRIVYDPASRRWFAAMITTSQ